MRVTHDFHDHHDVFAGRTSRIAMAIAFNLVITAAEFVGGIVSGSLALLSDAAHNLSDVFSLVLSLAGEKMAQTRPGKIYTFGLKRVEVGIALINALALLAVGAYIVHEAVERYYSPVPIHPEILLPVACIGLAGNAISIFVLHRDRNATLNMRAAFLHLLYDAISSIAVIVVGVIMFFREWPLLDLGIALGIVLMIVFSSFGIIREAMRIFMQGTPSTINSKDVYASIAGISGVESIHGLHIWSVSSSEIFLSCHIRIDPAAKLSSDDLIVNINRMLMAKYNIHHTTIQIETGMICGKGEHGKCCC
jgi:cobalt-zinc-cadmium efflux system protein